MEKFFTEKTLDLVPLSRFNEYYDYPTVGALRQLLFYNTDGFEDKVIRRVGKRIYIKISALMSWIEETNTTNNHERVLI